MSATELTLDEKRRFLADGFIVIREAVPRELTFRARRAVNMHAAREGVRRPYHDLAGDSPLPDLVNKSRLGEIMRNTMGSSTTPTTTIRGRSPSMPCATTGANGTAWRRWWQRRANNAKRVHQETPLPNLLDRHLTNPALSDKKFKAYQIVIYLTHT